MTYRKTGMVPRPAPRLTQQQLESEICPEEPDPKYIIEGIQREISCLQSEKNRLSTKFTQLSVEKKRLLEINSNLENELEDIVTETDNIIEYIKSNEEKVISLSKDVVKVEKNADYIQSSILSGDHYEAKMKELRELQIKKTNVEKKLKKSQKSIQRNDFSNFKEAIQMYQDDINTLEVNNMVIEQQIKLLNQQVSKCYNSYDQRKLNELYSAQDDEIQILLQKIRNAQRKYPDKQNSQEILTEEEDIRPTIEQKTSKEIPKKTLTNNNLSIHHLERRHSLLFNVKEEFDNMKTQCDSVNLSIERLLNDTENPDIDFNQRNELECLKSEVDTIAATIESEMRKAYEDLKLEEQNQLEINRINIILASRRDELKSIDAEKEKIISEIDEIIKKRGERRKVVDSLLENEKPEIQKLITKVQTFSKRCEEDADKLRNEEAEFNMQKNQLIEIKSSKLIAKFNDLLNKKAQLESEILHMKTSFKKSEETNEEYQEKMEEMEERKMDLLDKYRKYEVAYKVDLEELNALEGYACVLMTLINTNRNKKK